jgi:hypothetical protein
MGCAALFTTTTIAALSCTCLMQRFKTFSYEEVDEGKRCQRISPPPAKKAV